MTFILCSKKTDDKKASISFSGSHLMQFGFNEGCKVSVDIRKGKIVITLLENIDKDYIERI